MQKADLSNLGDGVVETTDYEFNGKLYGGTAAILLDTEDSGTHVLIPPEVEVKLNEAAVSVCSTGDKIRETIIAMVREQEKFDEYVKDAIDGCLEDDKIPNPIYIPKHIQHRKKGRR